MAKTNSLNKPAAGARSSAPDLVRDALRQAILSGELAAGVQLRQDEVAQRFGTSRIPVREALRQLASEGLVTFNTFRGAMVSHLSLDDVLELLDIRIGLECRALQLAIANMAQADIDYAEEILRKYDDEPDAKRWGEMNWKFHSALYAPCNRAKLLALIDSNYGHVDRFTRLQVSLAAGKDRPQREHHAILKACAAKKVDDAVRLLEEHIEETRKSLVAAVRLARRVA